jgi:hypothetical protein
LNLPSPLANATDSKIVLRRVNFPRQGCHSDKKELS